MSGQPRRTSSRIASQPVLVTVDWDDKWDDFDATVFKTGVHKSSSSQDCAAELRVRIGSLIHAISGKSMGSTQWGGLGPEERAFIEAYLGIKKGSIEALAT